MSMTLLSPDEIKKDREDSVEESMQRSNAMAAEESRLAKKINLARTNAERAIQEIDSNFTSYKAEIDRHREQLRLEVESLESRRAEALKPIEAIKEEAEAVLVKANQRASEVEQEALIVAGQRQSNVQLAEGIQDRTDELDSREQKLVRREQVIKDEEARIAQSRGELSKEWADLHTAVHDHNNNVKSTERKELEIADREKAIEIRAEHLNQREVAQNRERISLIDGYQSLERARKEVLGQN